MKVALPRPTQSRLDAVGSDILRPSTSPQPSTHSSPQASPSSLHRSTGFRAACTSSGRLIGVRVRGVVQQLGRLLGDRGTAPRRRRRASPCSRSRSARSSSPRGRSAGSRPSGRGSRSRAAAWRCPSPRRRARLFSFAADGDELVHAAVAVRHGQNVLHAAEQVVGVEHGVLATRAAGRPARACGCSSTSAPGRRRCRRSCAPGRSTWAGRSRGGSRRRPSPRSATGRYGASVSAHGDRAGAGAAAAVRAAEGLVRVEVHHVGAEIAGPRDAEDGVHVRAVEVDQPAARRGPARRSRRSAGRTARACSGW